MLTDRTTHDTQQLDPVASALHVNETPSNPTARPQRASRTAPNRSSAAERLSFGRRLVRNRWMFVPIGLLTLSVTVGVTTVALAVAGHPLGVEPDYYAKGAAWDVHRLQVAMNDKLRWTVAPTIVASDRGTPLLQLEVRDKYAGIIDADSIELEAIPVAVADARETGPMGRSAPGRFERELLARVPGQWEFRVTVKKGETVYTDTFRRTLHFAKGSSGTAPGKASS